MSQERIEILKMVGDKKITVEEAERLLRALDEREHRGEQGGRADRHGFGLFGLGENLRGIGDLIRTTVEEAVTGIGFGFDLDREGLEEVPVKDGRFEVPAGSQLVIRQRFHADLELVPVDGGTCIVEGAIDSLGQSANRTVLRLGKTEGRATRVQIPSTVGELKAGVPGGEIRATGLSCPATLKTMGGALRLVKLRKSFQAHTMGGQVFVELYPELGGDSSAETMGGKIEIVVPGGLRARIRANTLGGKVKVDTGLGEVVSRNSWGEQGAVVEVGGAGGSPRPEIRVNTMGGNVIVRKSEE